MSSQSHPSTASTSISALDRFFHISERGSTLGRELRGGVVTFFTMSYILVLNPLILGTALAGGGDLDVAKAQIAEIGRAHV